MNNILKNTNNERENIKQYLCFRNKSSAALEARYLDTYHGRYGSVLPQQYLRRRTDGGMERVPIPLTDPNNCTPALRGVKVNSMEFRGRTIAELGTNPRFKYPLSWQALAKKKGDAIAAAATATAAAATAAAATATATAAATATATATATAATTAAAATATPTTATAATATATAASGSGRNAALGGGSTGGGQGELGGGRAGATARARVTEGEREEEEAATAAEASANSRKRRRLEQKKKEKEEERKIQEEERAIREWIGTLPGGDLHGCHPLRGDFDVEHDNAAEELLAHMEFASTDDPVDKEVKLEVIGLYNDTLDERDKLKQFMVATNLLDSKNQPVPTRASKKKMPKEEREMRAKAQPLEPWSTADEHDGLVGNLDVSIKMRTEIAQGQEIRQTGVSTMAGGLEFENDQKKVHEKEGGVNPMDVTDSTGLEFTAEVERLLCAQLEMLPPVYLTLKDALLKENARQGYLSKNDLPRIILLEEARAHQLYDAFLAYGWVCDQPNNGAN